MAHHSAVSLMPAIDARGTISSKERLYPVWMIFHSPSRFT